MAEKLNPNRTAVALGALAALASLVWSALVASGLAQSLVNWKLSLYSLSAPLAVTAFDPMNAVLAIVFSAIGGAVGGYVLAYVWNWSAKFK